MEYTYNNSIYHFSRYPHTQNKSLQAWNAADEHILNYIDKNTIDCQHAIICNDSFGFLSCLLSEHTPQTIAETKSQEKACLINFKSNRIENASIINPLADTNKNTNCAIIKIPKSLDLFRLYINSVHRQLHKNGKVVCGFMTKHFTRQIIEIAEEYFEDISQSKAWKKSRLLILQNPREKAPEQLTHKIPFKPGKDLLQYFGVFSAKHIDYASLFFIEKLKVQDSENKILDLASGNGILAMEVQEQKPQAEIHLIDDSFLAVQSSKLNIAGNVHFHHNDCLDEFPDANFDLIITNPPFHFGHENNIEISLRLFAETVRCLKANSRMLIVANRHLNYKTHLDLLFRQCCILHENDKFVIYECVKL